MKIELHLFASLSAYLPADAKDRTCIIEAPSGIFVKDVVDKMKIPRAHVKLIFLNGIRAKDTDPLKDGDRLALFPPIGGG